MKIKLLLPLLGFAATTFAQIPTQGLISHYPFNGNAKDASGNSHHGTLSNVTLVADRFNRPGTAYSFANSTSSYVSIPEADIQLTNYTYSVWAYLNAQPANGDIKFALCIGSNMDQSINIQNQYLGSNGWGGGGYNTVSPNFPLQSYTSPNTKQWYHVLQVRDDKSMRFYINGVLVDSISSGSTKVPSYGTGTVKAYIGKRAQNSSPFDGRIDDVRIYNRRLTYNEIQALYNETPNCLLAHYTLDNTANDLSGNAYNGTAYNVTAVKDRFGNANSAYGFANSTSSYISIPSADLKLPTYTYSLWARLNDLPSNNDIKFALCIGGGGADQSINIQNNYLGSSTGWGGGGYNTVTPNFPLQQWTNPNANVWYHIAQVRDQKWMKYYINGVLIDSVTSSSIKYPDYGTGTTNAYIGKRHNDASPFDGDIDDVKIFNCVLDQNDISKLYNGATSSVKENSPMSAQVMMFPNPTMSAVKINIAGVHSGTYALRFTDLSGRTVLQSTLSAGLTEISLADKLSKGIYLVNLQDENSQVVYTQKLILQ